VYEAIDTFSVLRSPFSDYNNINALSVSPIVNDDMLVDTDGWR
jgi:hypothetical protein